MRYYNSVDEIRNLPGIFDRLRQLWELCGWNKAEVEGRDRTDAEWERCLKGSDHVIAVATDDGTVVGFGRLRLSGWFASIYDMVVDSRCRRQRIGTFIVEEFMTISRARGSQQINLDSWEGNPGAAPFYEGRGFRAVTTGMTLKI